METHCWADKADYLYFLEEHGDKTVSDELVRLWSGQQPSETCLLPYGHKGSHIWTNDSEIEVTFAEAGKGGW